MGMGEPFANYDNMWPAIERLHDDEVRLRRDALIRAVQRLCAAREVVISTD